MSELRKSLHDQFVIILTTLSRPVLLYVFSVLRLRDSSLPPLRDQTAKWFTLPFCTYSRIGISPPNSQSCTFFSGDEAIESAAKGYAMSYMFDYSEKIEFEHKVEELKSDIKRFTKACNSDWARPIDYTNLIDAQYALKALKTCMAA